MSANYLELLPYELQDIIWKNVYELNKKNLHIELLREVNNDISSSKILLNESPTMYEKKMLELMNTIYKNKHIKIYENGKNLAWFLIKYFSLRNKRPYKNPLGLNDRGRELFPHIPDMSAEILNNFRRELKDDDITYKILKKSSWNVLTYQELNAFKLYLINPWL